MNHYECLKVTPDAPTEVIRAAYRALAGKRHPDRQGGGTTGRDDEMHLQMVAINAAYEVLINPELRAEYDAMLAAKPRPTESRGGRSKEASSAEPSSNHGFSETRVDIDWLPPKPTGPRPLWPLTGSRRYIAIAGGSVLFLWAAWSGWQVFTYHQMDKALSDQYTARSSSQDHEMADEEGSTSLANALAEPAKSAPAPVKARDAQVPTTPEEVLASQSASAPASRTEVPPSSFDRQPTVTELSKLSDEELMAILPSLGELQPAKGSFSRQVAGSNHHPLDGKPLNLRTDRQLVDPLAPEAFKR